MSTKQSGLQHFRRCFAIETLSSLVLLGVYAAISQILHTHCYCCISSFDERRGIRVMFVVVDMFVILSSIIFITLKCTIVRASVPIVSAFFGQWHSTNRRNRVSWELHKSENDNANFAYEELDSNRYDSDWMKIMLYQCVYHTTQEWQHRCTYIDSKW